MPDAMSHLQPFSAILRPNESLAPFTLLKIGGPAEVLAAPCGLGELTALFRECLIKNIPVRVLGAGANLLIREEGVRGVVLRLTAPAFCEVHIEGKQVRAGCGGAVSALISAAARHGLAGLETLVGIPGSIGGALRHNAGDRTAEIGQFCRAIDVLDAAGQKQTRAGADLRFAYGACNIDDPILVAADFELESDHAEAIVKRMRKSWIQRKATQPYTFQAAARAFKNPAGLSASALIEQSGLLGTKVGAAQVSDRDANYIVAGTGATSRDVLRLIELMKDRVQERFNIELEQDLSVW
ncbi:MAG: UDP-N-acetylmuramate dehydrogenase [Planctomycetes bacterium]|nr:UDP-N-acetylmuramate dehydrogenase [Planctomycetota bacterium]